MYRPVLITPPTETPVSLAEVKAFLYVDDADRDELIASLIQSATQLLDGWSGILSRALVSQTWRQSFDDFTPCLRLSLRPVSSVSSVKYTDTDGTEQTISVDDYALRRDARGDYIDFRSSYSFPALNIDNEAVKVEFVAGYGAAEAVPEPLKTAIKLDVKQNFDPLKPDEVESYKRAYNALIAPYRVNRI